MKKVLGLALASILVALIAVYVPLARASFDQNSTESPVGAAVSVTPITEEVSYAKKIVNPTTSKVEPLKVVATPANSSTPSFPWTYVLIGVGCATILVSSVFIKRRCKFTPLRYLSLMFLLGLVTSASFVYGEKTLILTHWDLEAIGKSVPTIFRESIDSAGNVWFGNLAGGSLCVINPSTNEVKVWVTPGSGVTATVTVDKDDKIWFTDIKLYRIGRFDPSTNLFTIWSVPGLIDPDLICLLAAPLVSMDSQGRAYFSLHLYNKIARINPLTNELTEWPIPTNNSLPGLTMVDVTDNVWFVEFEGNKIGRLNPYTNEITEWLIPTANSKPSGLYVAAGQVFFTELIGKVGRLNPSTNEVTQWFLPVEDTPRGSFVDSGGNLWFKTNHYILKLNVNNIFTYWYIVYPSTFHSDGLAIDLKVNVGDIYVTAYRQTSWPAPAWGPYGDIYRFQPTTA